MSNSIKISAVDKENLVSQLHYAVKEGRLEKVKAIIAEGISPNDIPAREKECQGLSALHLAIRHEYLDIVEFLISAGADVDIEDNFGFRPIHDACLLGHTSSLRELLQKNASVDGVKRAGLQHITPLRYAAQQYHLDCLIMLKDRTPDAERILWETVSRRGNCTVLDVAGTHDDLSREDIVTITRQAALNGNLSFLVYACREIGIPSECAGQALLISAQHGRDAVTRFLIEQGLDANLRTERGLTALHYAARYGHIELMEDLLRMGANIDSLTDDNISPLHLAIRQCQAEAAAKLIDLGADRNLKGGEKNDTPLHMAIKMGDSLTLEEILSREPDLTLKNGDDKTPLQLTVSKDVKEILMRYFRN